MEHNSLIKDGTTVVLSKNFKPQIKEFLDSKKAALVRLEKWKSSYAGKKSLPFPREEEIKELTCLLEALERLDKGEKFTVKRPVYAYGILKYNCIVACDNAVIQSVRNKDTSCCLPMDWLTET